jgi:hypothetical protein
MRKPFFPSLSRNLILVLIFGGFSFLVAEKIVRWVDYLNSDFFSFWLSGRMMWTGQSPYFEYDWVQGHIIYGATWISDTSFLYPLPLALFYTPLGLLSLYNAYIIWIISLEVLIVSSVFALFFQLTKSERIKYIIPFLVGVVVDP